MKLFNAWPKLRTLMLAGLAMGPTACHPARDPVTRYTTNPIVHNANSVSLDQHMAKTLASYAAPPLDCIPYPLHCAAAQGDAAYLKRTVELGGSLDVRDKAGRTPLMFAAAKGARETLQFLLSQDQVEVNARDNDGATALHFGVASASRATVVSLLAGGADLNASNSQKERPLSLAAALENPTIFDLLLKEGAEVTFEVQLENGKSVKFLSRLIMAKAFGLANKLTNAGANLAVSFPEVVDHAVIGKLVDPLVYLSQKKALGSCGRQLESVGRVVDCVLARNLDEFIVPLRNQGISFSDLDSKGRSALYALQARGEKDLATFDALLAAERVDLRVRDLSGVTFLQHLLSSQNKPFSELVTRVVKEGADPDALWAGAQDKTILEFLFLEARFRDVTAVALAGRGNFNRVSAQCETLLMSAMKKEWHSELFAKALAFPLDVNFAPTCASGTPLVWATEGSERLNVPMLYSAHLEALIAKGADVNVLSPTSGEPLIFALVEKQDDTLTALALENVRDVNITDKQGNTVLHRKKPESVHRILDLLDKKRFDFAKRNGEGVPFWFTDPAYLIELSPRLGARYVGDVRTTDTLGRGYFLYLCSTQEVSWRPKGLGYLPEWALDPNAPGRAGALALHECLRRQGGKFLENLILSFKALGARLDAPEADGNTPLHIAVAQRSPGNAALLLQEGARSDSANEAGKSPLDVARESQLSFLEHILSTPQPYSMDDLRKWDERDVPVREAKLEKTGESNLFFSHKNFVVLGTEEREAGLVGFGADSQANLFRSFDIVGTGNRFLASQMDEAGKLVILAQARERVLGDENTQLQRILELDEAGIVTAERQLNPPPALAKELCGHAARGPTPPRYAISNAEGRIDVLSFCKKARSLRIALEGYRGGDRVEALDLDIPSQDFSTETYIIDVKARPLDSQRWLVVWVASGNEASYLVINKVEKTLERHGKFFAKWPSSLAHCQFLQSGNVGCTHSRYGNDGYNVSVLDTQSFSLTSFPFTPPKEENERWSWGDDPLLVQLPGKPLTMAMTLLEERSSSYFEAKETQIWQVPLDVPNPPASLRVRLPKETLKGMFLLSDNLLRVVLNGTSHVKDMLRIVSL